MRENRRYGLAIALFASVACTGAPPASAQDPGCEDREYDSTFDLIQDKIFDQHGCSAVFCHTGAQPQGGLDLSEGNAYASLIDQASTTVAGAVRVIPGQKAESLLWINLAAKTTPGDVTAPLRAMPPDPFPALSADELEAVRRWIEIGAPRDAVVPGTAELLEGCLPPPQPIEIAPLPAPPAGEGVQIKMPRWTLPPQSEREVCFASYYDITDQVPEDFRGPNGDTFRYKRAQVRQDPLSHHLIVNQYGGRYLPENPADWGEKICVGPANSPTTGRPCSQSSECGQGSACEWPWPQFTCLGGDRSGAACNPLVADDCGAGVACVTQPEIGIACVGFGPPDGEFGIASSGLLGSQETAAVYNYADGVYNEAPARGMIFWNSHAFNLTETPGKLEAWLNFTFAAPEEQVYPVQTIFDTSHIFVAETTPFTAEEVCQHHLLPPNSQLFELSSHTHKRGKQFRTFLGKFSCEGGPNDGIACDPLWPDPSRSTADVCAGAPCGASAMDGSGDCNNDQKVGVDEIVMGVNIALALAPLEACPEIDRSSDGRVTIDEVVMAVRAAIQPERDPDASLLYTNLVYNDPLVLRFDPPLKLPGEGSPAGSRTLTFCSLYDNGLLDPSEVKRQSTSPPTPIGIPGVLGGPCITPSHCTDGKIGEPCSGTGKPARDASCDSSPGAGDGFCDACTLRGGVTTEDEMFILMGSYFVQ